jgi:hypothetical protein
MLKKMQINSRNYQNRAQLNLTRQSMGEGRGVQMMTILFLKRENCEAKAPQQFIEPTKKVSDMYRR